MRCDNAPWKLWKGGNGQLMQGQFGIVGARGRLDCRERRSKFVQNLGGFWKREVGFKRLKGLSRRKKRCCSGVVGESGWQHILLRVHVVLIEEFDTHIVDVDCRLTQIFSLAQVLSACTFCNFNSHPKWRSTQMSAFSVISTRSEVCLMLMNRRMQLSTPPLLPLHTLLSRRSLCPHL